MVLCCVRSYRPDARDLRTQHNLSPRSVVDKSVFVQTVLVIGAYAERRLNFRSYHPRPIR